MNEAHEINKRWWDEVTPVHVGSDFYAVDRFLAGENKLGRVEREALGPESMLVIHDDLDLEAGRLQLKRSGGTGGHRGLDSIIESLGTDVFPRLRVGIGRPPEEMAVVDFVLEPYSAPELEEISETTGAGVGAIEAWGESGTESAMNIVNVRRKAP